MQRITFTENECQVRASTSNRLFLSYEDYPELSEIYDQAVEIVSKHRTPDQIKADEIAEFAIMADPEGALDVIPDWEAWNQYRIGEHVVYDGNIYRVIQSHRSQIDWLPDEVPALYTLANKSSTDPVDEIPEWVQPTGTHDAYNKGDQVMFEGKAYESLVDGNTWSPTDHPAGWQEIEGEA